MAGNLSDYAENKLLNHLLGIESFSMPENVYIALFNTDPTDAGTGTEVSGSGYERKKATGTFTKAVNGTTWSTVSHMFPAAQSLWGEITHIGIYDSPKGGNLLAHGKLKNEKTIAATDKIEIEPGNVKVVMD